MTNLTDEKRKELTWFLDEGWSELPHLRRGFTTPDDMVALAKRMVEKGVWLKFYSSAKLKFVLEDNGSLYGYDLAIWLITNPARFCWLVSEFLTKTEV